MAIEEGQKALDFKVADETNTLRSLSNYKGKNVLLYFYPKDMTSGCTIEAQEFRDKQRELEAANVQVIGVSVDDAKSHQKFIEKNNLKFPLLADVDHELVEKYGVWKEKNLYGRKYMGVNRESFLIDTTGIVRKHYPKVSPKIHAKEVLNDVKELGL